MLVHGLSNKKSGYSPVIRKFCFRMQFYSTAGYNALRKFFSNHLPTVRTLQRWLRVVDASPGITQIALDAITEKAQEYKNENKELLVTLVCDEMSIRKHVRYDEHKIRFDGLPTMVNSNQSARKQKKDDSNKVSLAKDALVFMTVGPNFRITVCYELLSGLDAIDRAVLTKEVIRQIDNTGAKVISLTGDGLHANVTVAKLLGANFIENKPYFPRPGQPNERVHIIFDPPHMLKLLRKYFAEQNLHHDTDEIAWEPLIKLAEKQDSDNFSFGNKLSNKHIRYNDAKMNVRLAVQTISNSVADSLEQLCEDGYEDFVGCGKTVRFLRLSYNVFDVMNYGEGKKTNDQYKIPLCTGNIEKIRRLFDEFQQFISGITIKVKRGKSVKRVDGKTQMGFFGLLVNMTSTLNIYEDYVQNGPLDMFYTFQFSQDNLEQYFSLVRDSLGSNINPTRQQFESAYRKLLFFTPHMSGDKQTNCNIGFPDALLEVSSKTYRSESFDVSSVQQNIEILMDYSDLIRAESGLYELHVSALTASRVQFEMSRDIKAQKKISCQNCLQVFNENPKCSDNLIERKQNRGQHIDQPCLSTMNIVLAANEICKIVETADYIDIVSMANAIFTNLEIDSLFEFSDFDTHVHEENPQGNLNHKEQFLLRVVKKYLIMKSKEIAYRIVIEEQTDAIKNRKSRRKTILAGKSHIKK